MGVLETGLLSGNGLWSRWIPAAMALKFARRHPLVTGLALGVGGYWYLQKKMGNHENQESTDSHADQDSSHADQDSKVDEASRQSFPASDATVW